MHKLDWKIIGMWSVFILGIFSFISQELQASSGINISPAQLDVTLAYGASEFKLGYITLTNNSNSSVTVDVSADSSINVGGYDVPMVLGASQLTISAGQSANLGYYIYTGGLNIQSNGFLQGKGKIKLVAKGTMVNLNTNVLIDLKLVYAKADIQVESLTISPRVIMKEKKGFVCKAVIKNAQTNSNYSADNCKDTNQFNVKWYINNKQVLEGRHLNLKAGQTSNELIATLDYYPGLERGQYAIKVEADTKNEVSEVNESNNSYVYNMSIPGVTIPVKPTGDSTVVKPITINTK